MTFQSSIASLIFPKKNPTAHSRGSAKAAATMGLDFSTPGPGSGGGGATVYNTIHERPAVCAGMIILLIGLVCLIVDDWNHLPEVVK